MTHQTDVTQIDPVAGGADPLTTDTGAFHKPADVIYVDFNPETTADLSRFLAHIEQEEWWFDKD